MCLQRPSLTLHQQVSKSLILSSPSKLKEYEIFTILPSSHPEHPQNHSSLQTNFDGSCEANGEAVALDQVIPGTGFKVKNLREIWDGRHSPILPHKLLNRVRESYLRSSSTYWSRQIEINLTARDMNRWEMSWRAVQNCEGGEVLSESRNGIPLPMALFREHQDWPNLKDFFEKPTIALGFSVAAFIYGGLHALAWFAHFQSSTAQLLWWISACMVMGGFPIEIGVVWFFKLLEDWDPRERSSLVILYLLEALLFLLLSVLFVVLVCALPVAYMLARAYLVIECFINLSQLPAGVYDMPNWSAYFPHIA